MNCRSIFKKLPEIDILFRGIDFLMCSETWLDNRYNEHLIQLSGKCCFRTDRSYNNTNTKKGGGVAIFVNDNWANYVTIDNNSTFSNVDLEIVTLLIDRPNHRKLTISCVYRPPKSNQDNTYNELTRVLKYLSTLNREIWVGGDFNWDWNRRNHEQLQRVKNLLWRSNLHQLINGVTRPLTTGGTCIDWLITNCDNVAFSGVAADMISDHLRVFAVKKKCRNRHLKKRLLTRSYKKFDKDSFVQLLLNSAWATYFDQSDPDELWNILYTNITDILSIMCPLKYKNVFVNKPDWLTQDIMELMNQRNYYVKLAKERGAEIYYKLSRFLRNKCNKIVNSAKGKFIRDKLHENKKHPKRFWREIHSLLSSKKDQNAYQELIDPETDELCAVGTESGVINTYYANIGSKILRNHTGVEPWDHGTDRRYNMGGFSFDEIDAGELEFVLSNIEIGKSSGMENISSNVLKICFTTLLAHLTHVYNCSIRLGRFPTQWATGTITPIPKCGDSKLVSNWRPIALVPLPGKVMERLIHKRLLEIILELNILAETQFGFIPGRSTSQAVFKLYKDLSSAMNMGNLSAVLYIDLSKAFDSIHHGRLLNKLSMLGLDPLAVSWLESYLTRSQTTIFNGKLSEKMSVSSGVPQGSVLGPLLFTVYINDLCEIVKDCKIILYADDIVLYTSHRNLVIVQAKLQRDANNLSDWCTKNLLCVNVKKTKSMLIGTRQRLGNTPPIRVKLNNTVIESVVSYNYLGVILDSELSLSYHLSGVHDRVQRKLFHLRKIRKYLNEFASVQVYKG